MESSNEPFCKEYMQWTHICVWLVCSPSTAAPRMGDDGCSLVGASVREHEQAGFQLSFLEDPRE